MMEQSKLISGIIAKLRLAYPYYFKDLDETTLVGMVKLYQEQIVGYNPKVVIQAIDKIIKTSKYMPSIAEILEACDNSQLTYFSPILEKMKQDGYFSKCPYTESGYLDEAHAGRNYEKALKFITDGIIPDWFKEDMKKYGYVDYSSMLDTTNKDLKQIGA